MRRSPESPNSTPQPESRQPVWDLIADEEKFAEPLLNNIIEAANQNPDPWALKYIIRNRIRDLKDQGAGQPETDELIDLLERQFLTRTKRAEKLAAYEGMRAESDRWQKVIDLIQERLLSDQTTETVEQMLIPYFVELNTLFVDEVHSLFPEEAESEQLLFLAKERLLQVITTNLSYLPPTLHYGKRVVGASAIIEQAIGIKGANTLQETVNRFLLTHGDAILEEHRSLPDKIKAITPEIIPAALPIEEPAPEPVKEQPAGEPAQAEPAKEAAPTEEEKVVEPTVEDTEELVEEVEGTPEGETIDLPEEIAESIHSPNYEKGYTFETQFHPLLTRLMSSRAVRIALSVIAAGQLIAKPSTLTQPTWPPLAKEITINIKPLTPETILENYQEQIKQPLFFDREDIIEDVTVIHPGSEVYTSELTAQTAELSHNLFGNPSKKPSKELLQRYSNTIRLMKSAKDLWPQAVKFKFTEEYGRISLQPVDWQEKIEVKQDHTTNVTVVGGEIESIVAAMRAVKQDQAVTLLYQADKLGNLNSDNGANLAFFDGVGNKHVRPPEEQLELFRYLGMKGDNLFSLPNDNLHQKLETFLQTYYPQIVQVPTRSFNSLHLKTQDNSHQLITEEGVRLTTNNIIDTTPESIIAEKANLPMNPDTPNLANGLVFDARNMQRESLKKLESERLTHPDRILSFFNLTKADIKDNDQLMAYYKRCILTRSKSTASRAEGGWGYTEAGQGYLFYAKLLEHYGAPELRPKIKALNAIRIMDGFNVAFHQGSDRATFNSISYRWQERLHQGDHNLQTDPQFALLREVEMPALQNYMRQIVNDYDVSIQMPPEFYIRQANAFFETLAPRDLQSLSSKPNGSPTESFDYMNDYRGLTPRFSWDKAHREANKGIIYSQHKPLYLTASAKHGITRVPGLYIINKSSQTASTFGITRIQQNLALHARLTVDAIANGKIQQIAAQLIERHDHTAKLFDPIGPLVAQVEQAAGPAVALAPEIKTPQP